MCVNTKIEQINKGVQVTEARLFTIVVEGDRQPEGKDKMMHEIMGCYGLWLEALKWTHAQIHMDIPDIDIHRCRYIFIYL